MPSINELAKLKPIRSDFNSDVEFSRLSALWEDHIAPVIDELERMAGTRPQLSSFEDSEDFEEAFGFWMQRQGRIIAMRLSDTLKRWQILRRSDDG
jgi:hypothetical protein